MERTGEVEWNGMECNEKEGGFDRSLKMEEVVLRELSLVLMRDA